MTQTGPSLPGEAPSRTGDARDDAEMDHARRVEPPGADAAAQEKIVQRWRDLRAMLIRQLELFESGELVLHSSDVDISPAAIGDLKRSILEFDALISGAA
jgi:hypothetical protein